MKEYELKTAKQRRDAIFKLGSEAIKNAQKENSRLGFPNDYVIEGKTIYHWPDGSITTKNPWQ